MVVGKIVRLRRYPVKSMLGEELSSACVTSRGLAGDRAVALVEARTGQLVSCKEPRKWARMFQLAATFEGGLRVTFPDGRVVSQGFDEALSAFLGREVRVVFEPPEEMAFFDFAPLHLVTTGSLAALSALAPGSRFDVERFRPNVVVETHSAGFVDDGWEGRELRLGASVVIKVECGAPRCVMTTLPQGDLPADKKVLKTIARAHQRPFFEVDQPALGVYAQVESGGNLRIGDEVVLT